MWGWGRKVPTFRLLSRLGGGGQNPHKNMWLQTWFQGTRNHRIRGQLRSQLWPVWPSLIIWSMVWWTKLTFLIWVDELHSHWPRACLKCIDLDIWVGSQLSQDASLSFSWHNRGIIIQLTQIEEFQWLKS